MNLVLFHSFAVTALTLALLSGSAPSYAQAIESVSNCRLPIRDRGREGFVDCDGRTVIDAKFAYVKEFSEGRAIGLEYGTTDSSENSFVILDLAGKVRARFPVSTYSEIRPFRSSRAIVSKGNLFGVIDVDGREIVPPKYEYIRDYSDGRAAFLVGGRVGYLDESGNIAIDAQFDPMRFHSSPHGTQFHSGMSDFSEGVAAAGERGERGYIDSTGRTVIPFQYEIARRFVNGLAAVRVNGKMGFVDRSGDIRVRPQFDLAGDFSENFAVVGINGKYGFIDTLGNQMIDLTFDNVCSFKEGMACMEQNGRYGLINAKGKVVVSPRYDVIHSFRGDLAFATKDGLTHLLHRSGKVLATSRLLQYDTTFKGEGRLVRVEVCNGVAYLNDRLKVIWPDDLGDRCSQDENRNYCEDPILTPFDRKVVCASFLRRK